MHRLDKRIGLRVSAHRQRKNMSLEALSKSATTTEEELELLEGGEITASPRQLRKLSQALDVPITELLPPIRTGETDAPTAKLDELRQLVATMVQETGDVELLTNLVTILHAERQTSPKGN